MLSASANINCQNWNGNFGANSAARKNFIFVPCCSNSVTLPWTYKCAEAYRWVGLVWTLSNFGCYSCKLVLLITTCTLYLFFSLSECEDGNSRLVNPSISATYNSNGTVNNTITGLIEVCFSGSWLTVCADGYQNTEGNRKAINYTCQNMGYDGMWRVMHMCRTHCYNYRSTSLGLHTKNVAWVGELRLSKMGGGGKGVSLCGFHFWYFQHLQWMSWEWSLLF